jgi:hypothetical protein
MIERIVLLSALLAGSFFYPFLTAQTGGLETPTCTVNCAENQKAQAQRHQIRMETSNLEAGDQETDNKVREMANETYVNRVKTSDKQQ